MIIGILGSPSTGKTTTARSLAGMLSTQTDKHVEYVDEFATHFINKYKKYLKNGFPSIEDQYLFINKQLKKESDSSADIIITDSPIFLSLIYAQRVYNKKNIKEQFYYNEIQNICLEHINRYAYLFYCPIGVVKIQKKKNRLHDNPGMLKEIDNQIKGYLNLHCIKYVELPESEIEIRIKKIVESIDCARDD
ncbi:MAG: AAA family ATPase [bacterium]|nr:AAA family ATPase [bacterium]